MIERSLRVGIDPGWVNTGFSIVLEERDTEKEDAPRLTLVKSEVFVPRDMNDGIDTPNEMVDKVFQAMDKVMEETSTHFLKDVSLVMERFVSYKGVSVDRENVLILIGMIQYAFLNKLGCSVELIRAIDWKIELVHLLFKQVGFQNPSNNLDKNFSIAAALACLGVTNRDEKLFKTDHEADATCLACLPVFREQASKRKTKKS